MNAGIVLGQTRCRHQAVATQINRVVVAGQERRSKCNATIKNLGDNARRAVMVRFDFWIDDGHNTRYFHGWHALPQYKECFTFKWKVKRQCHRLYGFLCNPKKKTHPGFQVCVLVYHGTKNEWETDFSILDRINRLRTDDAVMTAVNSAYPDIETKDKPKWMN